MPANLMPGSEIDDIFAGKSDERKADKHIGQTVPKKKKKKQSKRLSDPLQPQETSLHSKSKLVTVNEDSSTGKKRKRQAPEEIVDPSAATVKRRKTEDSNFKLPSKRSLKGDDVQKFKDSRGSSGR
jgi:hypothetical protein